MKKIVIAFFVFLLGYSTQGISQVGIKLGVHSFDLSSPMDILFSDNNSISYKNADLGFQGGLYGRIKLGNLFIEPRLMFHSTKVNYNIDGENGGIIDNIRSESFTNLDIPFLIGIKLLFLDVFAGPVAHLHVNSTSDLVDFDSYERKFEAATYGLMGGIGVTMGDASLSLEYERSNMNFGDHITIGGQKFNFGDKPARLMLNFGYRIF